MQHIYENFLYGLLFGTVESVFYMIGYYDADGLFIILFIFIGVSECLEFKQIYSI